MDVTDTTYLDDQPTRSAKSSQSANLDSAELDDPSQPFIGRWNQLVSTTNWEKGRIINQWREALIAAGAPAAEYSDEAWVRRVSGVTGQHVGRLRRVYQRFKGVYADYAGLYWSHFHAALDWNDAEMWLEGGVQNGWSVSQMRRTRWETLGGDQRSEPREDDVVSGELDEDFEPALNQEPIAKSITGAYEDVAGPRHDGPDFGDEDQTSGDAPRQRSSEADGASADSGEEEKPTVAFVRPFENLAELPDDLTDAFESFKLAILRHKAEGWQQISRDDVLASLDALKELALAPSAEDSPF